MEHRRKHGPTRRCRIRGNRAGDHRQACSDTSWLGMAAVWVPRGRGAHLLHWRSTRQGPPMPCPCGASGEVRGGGGGGLSLPCRGSATARRSMGEVAEPVAPAHRGKMGEASVGSGRGRGELRRRGQSMWTIAFRMF